MNCSPLSAVPIVVDSKPIRDDGFRVSSEESNAEVVGMVSQVTAKLKLVLLYVLINFRRNHDVTCMFCLNTNTLW